MSRIDSLEKFSNWKDETGARRNAFRAWKDHNGRVDEENFWIAREYIRMQTQEYAKLSFELPDNLPENLFPHVSLDKNKTHMIAYTPDAEKGKRDLQTRGKFGKFMKRYFPDMPDHEIAQVWAPKWNASTVSHKVEFTQNSDEIAVIYQHGPRSCMDGRHFSHINANPTRVYATPDISLAYIGDTDALHFTARAVCNMKDLQFTSVYGDPMLREYLMQLGFEPGGLEGCRIRRIPHPNSASRFIAPYLDGNALHVRFTTKEEDPFGEFLVVEASAVGVHSLSRNLDGSVIFNDRPMPYMAMCHYCDRSAPKTPFPVYGDGDRHVCTHCRQNYLKRAYLIDTGDAVWAMKDDVARDTGGSYRLRSDLEAHGYALYGRFYAPSTELSVCPVTGRTVWIGETGARHRVLGVMDYGKSISYEHYHNLSPMTHFFLAPDVNVPLFPKDAATEERMERDPNFISIIDAGAILAMHVVMKFADDLVNNKLVDEVDRWYIDNFISNTIADTVYTFFNADVSDNSHETQHLAYLNRIISDHASRVIKGLLSKASEARGNEARHKMRRDLFRSSAAAFRESIPTLAGTRVLEAIRAEHNPDASEEEAEEIAA